VRCSGAFLRPWQSSAGGRDVGQGRNLRSASSRTCGPWDIGLRKRPAFSCGYGRQRLSFSVPRLRRGVHRPAAAALRAGADVVGDGRLGRTPAAAVARRPQAWGGKVAGPGLFTRWRRR